MSEIPHPFIVESTEFFKKIKDEVEINFIHFNHTNPLLNEKSDLRIKLSKIGYGSASLFQNLTYKLIEKVYQKILL